MGKIRTVIYHDKNGKEIKIDYDEDNPCFICGEPVIGASMGGTAICVGCDCGKCRYCGMEFFVMKPEIDGGRSKQNLLEHMKWHNAHTPEIVERYNSGMRRLLDDLEERRNKRINERPSDIPVLAPNEHGSGK